jgi:hypothetical protein
VEIVDFLHEIVDTVSMTLAGAFPEVETTKDETISILAVEVLRYLDILKTIANSKDSNPLLPPLLLAGFPNLKNLPKSEIEKVKTDGKIDGNTAFIWYVFNSFLYCTCISNNVVSNYSTIIMIYDFVEK